MRSRIRGTLLGWKRAATSVPIPQLTRRISCRATCRIPQELAGPAGDSRRLTRGIFQDTQEFEGPAGDSRRLTRGIFQDTQEFEGPAGDSRRLTRGIFQDAQQFACPTGWPAVYCSICGLNTNALIQRKVQRINFKLTLLYIKEKQLLNNVCLLDSLDLKLVRTTTPLLYYITTSLVESRSHSCLPVKWRSIDISNGSCSW
jgi:hypothetical protein